MVSLDNSDITNSTGPGDAGGDPALSNSSLPIPASIPRLALYEATLWDRNTGMPGTPSHDYASAPRPTGRSRTIELRLWLQ